MQKNQMKFHTAASHWRAHLTFFRMPVPFQCWRRTWSWPRSSTGSTGRRTRLRRSTMVRARRKYSHLQKICSASRRDQLLSLYLYLVLPLSLSKQSLAKRPAACGARPLGPAARRGPRLQGRQQGRHRRCVAGAPFRGVIRPSGPNFSAPHSACPRPAPPSPGACSHRAS